MDLKIITRKGIGKLLQDYKPDDKNPIDCFFFQLSYPFRKWIKTLEVQESVEDAIAKIADEFFSSKESAVYGKWYKVDDGWPLTYFLDAQEQKKRQELSPDESWYEFEEYLNKNVRQKLREVLKEKDQSFRDLPIVIMRVCKYTRDDDDIN